MAADAATVETAPEEVHPVRSGARSAGHLGDTLSAVECQRMLDRAGVHGRSAAVVLWSRAGRNDVALLRHPELGAIVAKRSAQWSTGNIATEVQVHQGFDAASGGRLGGLRVPGLVGASAAQDVVVRRGLADHMDLRMRMIRGESVRPMLVAAGEGLALLHNSHRDSLAPWSPQMRPRPSGLLPVEPIGHGSQRSRPPDWLHDDQWSDVVDAANALQRTWTQSAVTHGDATLMNILSGSVAAPESGYLIDWEFAGLGDPRWDVGALIGSLIWVFLELRDRSPVLADRVRIRQCIDEVLIGYADAADSSFASSEALAWSGYWLAQRSYLACLRQPQVTAVADAARETARGLLCE